MSSRRRRFEVLIPVQFKDGREAPDEWLAEAFNEIVDHFGAANFDTHGVGSGVTREPFFALA